MCIRAGLQQGGHVGEQLPLDCPVEWRRAAAVSRVHLAATRDKSSNRPGPTAVSRPVKRRLAPSGGGVHVGARVQQNRDEFGVVALTRGVVQGGSDEARRIGVCSESQEPSDDVGELVGRTSESTLQDGHSALVAVVDIRAGLDQSVEHCGIPEASVGRHEQWSITLRVPGVDVRPGLKQHRHGLAALHRGRLVQGGRARGRQLVHIRPRGHQDRHDGGVFDAIEPTSPWLRELAPGGVEQCSTSLAIASVHIRADFQQQGHDGGVFARGGPFGTAPPVRGREQKWSVSVLVPRVHVRPGLQAGSGGLGGGDAGEHRRIPVPTVHGIGDLALVVDQGGVGAEFEQQMSHGGIPGTTGSMKRGAPVAIPRVEIRAGLYQLRDDNRFVRLGSQVEGCLAMTVARFNIRSGLKQHGEDCGVPRVAGCEMQRSVPAFRGIPVNVVSRVEVRPGLEARRHALGGGGVEEVVRVPVFAAFLRGRGKGEEGECPGACQPCNHLHSLQPIPDGSAGAHVRPVTVSICKL